MARTHYRTVWISDTHLGSRGAQGETLARFLKRIDCDTLYLVGDIIDFWRLRKRRAYWPSHHNDVLRRILKLMKRGTEVVIVPGNHDEGMRQYAGMVLGGIQIHLHTIHICADGQRLLVTHGDQHDLVVTKHKLLSAFGSTAYEHLLSLNRWYNRYRRWRGLPYWSLSQYLKLKVKSACTYISRFRETLLREASEYETDGVVCGHIHKPEIDCDNGTMNYYNCGDWIENCTALVEHADGKIELIYAHDFLEKTKHVDEEDYQYEQEADVDLSNWMDPVRIGEWSRLADKHMNADESEHIMTRN